MKENNKEKVVKYIKELLKVAVSAVLGYIAGGCAAIPVFNF